MKEVCRGSSYQLSPSTSKAARSPDSIAPSIQRGEVLFTDLNCDICHERDGKTPGQGPNLGGYGQATWIRGLLQDPASPLYFGEKNDMPLFGKKLSKTELERLTLYLREQRLNP